MPVAGDRVGTVSLPAPLLPRTHRWLAVAAVAALIGYWSLVTTPPTSLSLSLSLSFEFAFGTAPTADTTVRAATVADAPRPSHVRHAIAYATLGLAISYALVGSDYSSVRKSIVVFALATGYGALVEVGQLFLADRVASPIDVVANAVGAACSLGWFVLERHVRFVPVQLDPIGSIDGFRR